MDALTDANLDIREWNLWNSGHPWYLHVQSIPEPAAVLKQQRTVNITSCFVYHNYNKAAHGDRDTILYVSDRVV
jgi:hypothetical protein